MFAAGDGRLFDFINKDLLPHLHGLDIDPRTGLPNPTASRKQRIIGRIMTAVERVVRVDPEPGKTIYDLGCGTGGFLTIAYEHIARKLRPSAASTAIDTLKVGFGISQVLPVLEQCFYAPAPDADRSGRKRHGLR